MSWEAIGSLAELVGATAVVVSLMKFNYYVMYSFFEMFEKIYLHYLAGSVAQDVWTHNYPMLLAYSSQPDARYYLAHRRKIFDPRYWDFLEQNQTSDVPAGHVQTGCSLQDAARLLSPWEPLGAVNKPTHGATGLNPAPVISFL